MDALSSLPKDEIDLSSDDESSVSSHDEYANDGPKNKVTDYEGFEKGFDENDPIAKQMESIISLKLSLGIDNDKEFLAEHEKKKAELERERLEKEREAERIANMTTEERIRYESEQASSLLSSVKSNFLAKQQEELQKRHAWEKPEWAKKKSLRSTAAGQAVKKGADLQGPITQAPHLKKDKDGETEGGSKPKLKQRAPNEVTEKNIAWEKPEWAKTTKLKSTSAGDAVKKGVDLQAPITQAPHMKNHSPLEEAPARRLKATRESETLSKKKNIEWEKPDWAKTKKLRSTAAGEAVKKGVDLQGPITQAPHVKKDTQAEVLDFLKKNVKKSKPGEGSQSSLMESPTKAKKSKVKILSDPKSPKTPRTPKSPNENKDNDTQAEVMNFLKKNMKKTKSKRNLIVNDGEPSLEK